MLFLTMCVGYIFFIIPINLRDDSDGFTATCTVTKAYTQERRGTDLGGMTDIGLKGVFETEECGTLTIFEPPEGWKISAYVKTAHSGKKYLFHVSNRSNRKDRDFTTTRFEEIKE
ncbi:MAG: hypothetical protein HXO58_08365 [Rothia mucilaginosa]|uniref:Uncharacterized protein n=1 Tax=Rothia mucilaginosa TaxID=43675 RepID=A0A930L6L4_9MICC|nr:hypothetical protein [Rothia mucilaginosa]MBF1659831.1 hypothetical protein [Rothia mucilaginosa]